MIRNISNGYHIHDTLTSGLRLPIDDESFRRIRDIFNGLKEEKTKTPFKENDKIAYYWRVTVDKPTRIRDADSFGAIESASWSVALYRSKDQEHFTSIGIKISKERVRDKDPKLNGKIDYFVTLTANPTAIMRGDFATDTAGEATSVEPLDLLTKPFNTLADIAGDEDIFSEDEWKIIDGGELKLRDIEIAFPLKLISPDYLSAEKIEDITARNDEYGKLKSDIVLHFSRIYGTRLSLKDKVWDIGDILDCTFSRYPEDSRLSQSTGFMLTMSERRKNSLFCLKMYDKVAEMRDKNKKWAPEDKTREAEWEKYLRVDIRLYPQFMKELYEDLKLEVPDANIDAVAPEDFSINDWIKIEKAKEKDFSQWLLRKILGKIEFPFLSSTVEEVKTFTTEIATTFSPTIAKKWQECITYVDSDLGLTKTQKNNMAEFRKSRHAPAKIGGLIFNMQNAFNFTSVLEEKDFAQVFDIDGLANVIKTKGSNLSYDQQKVEFRAPICKYVGYELTEDETKYLTGK